MNLDDRTQFTSDINFQIKFHLHQQDYKVNKFMYSNENTLSISNLTTAKFSLHLASNLYFVPTFQVISNCQPSKKMSGIRNPENFEDQIKTNVSLSSSRDDLYSTLLANLKFKQNERILDYGCGTGKFFKTYLFEHAIANQLELIGVDISEDMIKHAQQNSSIPGITDYRVGNIMDMGDTSLESEEEKFDKIFATFLIQVVEDYEELFERLRKYLKPGGSFSAIIPTNYLARPFTLLPKIDKFWETNYPDAISYLASWVLQDPSKGEFIPFDKALVSSGFKVLDYRHQLLVLEFDDISKYWSHFIGNHGSLSSIPNDSALYEKLEEDLTTIARNMMTVNVGQRPFVNESQIYFFTAEKK